MVIIYIITRKSSGSKTQITKIRSGCIQAAVQIRRLYRNEKPQSEAARLTMKAGVDQLETAYDLWIRGIVNASRNLRHMEKTADDGGAKLQARYSETTDILSDFNIAENKMSDYIYVQRNVYNTLLKDGFFDKSETVGSNIRKFRTDVNTETGMVIETGRKGIKETFSLENYGKVSKQLKSQKLAVVRSLPEILQKGHLIEDNTSNYHKDNSGLSFAYIRADIEIGGTPVMVKVAIRKSQHKNSFWVHYIETKDSTEIYPDGTQPMSGSTDFSAENNVPQSADKVKRQSRSDADYLSAVEHGDMETAQRMVGEALRNIADDVQLPSSSMRTPEKAQKKQPPYWVAAFMCWHLPIFPGRRQPSIFGTTGLNFRVRDGNGWTPCVINTNCSFRNSCYYSTVNLKMQALFNDLLIIYKFS